MATAKGLVKRLLNLPLKPLGLEVARRNANPVAPKEKGPLSSDRLKQIARLGFKPKVIYDCGAYRGTWSAAMAPVFPGAEMFLVEPNPTLYDTIRKNTAGIQPPPTLVEAAVGETEGTAELNIWDNAQTSMAGSSLLPHVQGAAGTKATVKVMPIDAIAAQYGKSPDFLKLDLQGFEIAALKGATRVLQTVELCEIEFGVLEAYVGRATPRQLIDIMYDNNYTLYDIVDLIYRPYDNALTGGDFFFVKNDSPLRQYKAFR